MTWQRVEPVEGAEQQCHTIASIIPWKEAGDGQKEAVISISAAYYIESLGCHPPLELLERCIRSGRAWEEEAKARARADGP